MHSNTERTGLSHKYLCHTTELEKKEAGPKHYSVHSPFQSRLPSMKSLTNVHLVSTYIL